NAEAGFIQHHSNGLLAFGQFVDPENDGNAGATSTNPPNQDECVGGTDAGLIAPSAYTIDDGSTMPCDPLSTTPLGGGCGTVTVGPNLDIAIRNINQGTCYFNLLIDLDYSGSWGGPTQCPLGGDTDEHVFQNIVVPNNFSGELSDLLPGATFTITSPPGYTWARFTLTSVPVPVDWDGSGDFANGETEDYLFRIEGPGLGDYGDAPENALAYPNSGYWGAFATCAADGFPHFVYHRPQGNVWIGATKDFETEGNGGYCTIENQVPDQDECGNNVDGGLVNPDAYTIDANGWDVPCEANQLRPLGQPCTVGTIGPSLNIRLHNGEATSMRFNLLVDWNQDGYWYGLGDCGTYQEDEHLIRNVEVPAGFDGLLSTLTGPTTFNIPSAEGTVWVRATIGENFVSDDWNGFFVFNQGETEDYKLAIINDVSGIPDGGTKPRVLHLGPAFPNPSAGLTAIRYTLPADGPVRLAIFDISGRAIASLDIPHAEAGQHSWEWDGRDELGRLTPAGIYVVKLESGGVTQSMKVTRVR
ncbi:MAG TPA: FlgD immunoglobulin-like domain containing protein, partial [Candidatus Eisenbacteria bacterium]